MALFEQKIKTLFTRFDADRNGMIEVDDFHKWAASLARYGQRPFSIIIKLIQINSKHLKIKKED